jgi:hypothetical protein
MPTVPLQYTLARAAPKAITTPGQWSDVCWKSVPALRVDQFAAQSSDHRPATQVKLLHDGQAIHVFFRVQDRYVVCRNQGLHVMVCTDSCVEFFVRPRPDKGYFNFEFNCGGSMLLYFIEDWTRTPDGFVKFRRVTQEQGQMVQRFASLPPRTDPENPGPLEWTLHAVIPVALLEEYLGPLGPLAGQRWQGNFFKCADKSSHPHWATWSPIGTKLDFHQPDKFGAIILG